MHKYLLTCLFLIFCLPAISQDLKYARHILDTLSSASFYGRGYVNRGDSLAAEFIASQIKQIGLKPIEETYFQTFTHNVNTLPGQAVLSFDGENLNPGYQYYVDPASSGEKGKLKLEEIKYEEVLSTEWIEKIEKSKNKALYIDLTDLDKLDNKEKDKVREFSQYLKFEDNLPAKAIVFFQKGKQPWYVSNTRGYRAIFTVFKDSINGIPEKISFDVDAEYIENYRSKNVIGIVPGTADPDSIIVLTAHYDHLGTMGSDTYFPGANDNASGAALLLDLARYFSENPIDYTICFIAFAGEEAGLVGSRYFVENPLFDLSKIKFLINLDLAGTGVDGAMVVNGKIYEEQFHRLTEINNQNGYLKEVKARGEACNSDHCPFHQNGIKSFYLYTLGGTKYYHDIFDKSGTLPLKEYENYFLLIRDFIVEME